MGAKTRYGEIFPIILFPIILVAPVRKDAWSGLSKFVISGQCWKWNHKKRQKTVKTKKT